MNHSITTKTEIQLIEGVSCYEENGVAYIRLEDAARGLGFTQIANSGNEVIRWERVRKYLAELGIPTSGDGNLPEYIPENIFYRLCMKANNETAQKFQALVCDVILPELRKRGYATLYPVGQPSSLQILNMMVQAVNEQAARSAETEKRVDAIESSFNNMCSIMTISVKDDARKVCQRTLNAIATKRGGGTAYADVWNEVYDEMKENGFDVRRRLDNRKKDAASKGMSKTFVRKINAVDIIFDSKDKKMESAFINSVRRLAAATNVKFEVKEEKQSA